MATGLDGFAEHLKQAESQIGEFRAAPYYEPETDSLIFYKRDEPSYSKRINRYFTVFLADKDDSLVGFEVKGLNATIIKAIEGMGEVSLVDSVPVTGEDVEAFALQVIMHQALVDDTYEPVSGRRYEELNSLARGVRVPKRSLCEA